jgi:acetylglutamate/LysW-gamma-L-alpha-aminoadipate kinase
VVSPPAMAPDGEPVNVDADRAAAALAAELGAETLVMLTGAPGVLADSSDPGSLLGECQLPRWGATPALGGGMGIKLVAAREALLAGVPRVLIADGRGESPLQKALSGSGTRVTLRRESASPLGPEPTSGHEDVFEIRQAVG